MSNKYILLIPILLVTGLFMIVSSNGTSLKNIDIKPTLDYNFDENPIFTNLISNGDFEQYTTSPGPPNNWIFSDGGGATQISKENSIVFSNSNSVKITSDAVGKFPGIYQDISGLLTSESYCIFAHARTNSNNIPFAMGFQVYDITASNTVFNVSITPNTGWQTFSNNVETFIPQSNNHIYRISLYMNVNNGATASGKVGYFDSIQLYKISASTIDSSNGLNAKSCGVLPTNGLVNNGAYKFDNSAVGNFNPRVIVEHNNYLNSSTFSIATVFKLNAYSNTVNPRIADLTPSAAGNSGWFFYVSDLNQPMPKRLSLDYRDVAATSTGRLIRSNTLIQPNVIYTGLIVKSENKLSIYINGTLDNSTTVNFPIVYNNIPLVLGNRFNTITGLYDRALNGTIDYIKYYNYALTDEQARQLYLNNNIYYSVKVTNEFSQFGFAIVPIIVGLGFALYMFTQAREGGDE